MTDVMKSCASCGNTQAAGDFCEKCGNRLAAPAAEAAAPAATAAFQAPPAPAAYPPGAYAPGAYPPGAYPPGAYPPGTQPPYGYAPQYAPPREPGPWNKLFDLSFQGFVTPATLKVLYFIILGTIGLFFVFSIVWGFMFHDGAIGAMWLFVTVAMTAFLFFMTRILFELVSTTLRHSGEVKKDV